MILVNLMGGLGNQMFQYAAGKSLALRHHVDLKYVFSDNYPLANRSVRIDNFNIDGKPLQSGEAKDYLPKRKLARYLHKWLGLPYEGRIFRETLYYDFDPAFKNLPDKTYLYGFWQSWHYVEGCGDIIRKEFTTKKPSPNYQLALARIQSLEKPVSIHVRRGDYLNDKSGFSALPLQYYDNAHHSMSDAVGAFTPVVFSDDTEWVKGHLNSIKEPIFASEFNLQDFEELMLMRYCSHHIIANSSFSWWGAWLNSRTDKVVIAPSHWHSLLTKESTLIPPTWKVLS